MLSKEELTELARVCYRDPVKFCRTFLEDWFPTDMPWVHRGLLAILLRRTEFLHDYGEVDKIIRNFIAEDGSPIFYFEGEELKISVKKFTAIRMPRGYSKTTLLNAVVIFVAVYKVRRFPVYVSEAGPHAETQLGNIRRVFETNDRIKAVFGDLRPNQREGRWSEGVAELTNGVVIVARGRGAQIRGLNHHGRRPDFIVADDLEDKESVSTDLQRAKAKEWAYGDLMPALPAMDEDATITALGTLLHPEALLQALISDRRWTSVTFSAVDRDGELLWERNMNWEKLALAKESFAGQGLLHVYYMEYFNAIRAPEKQKFRSEYLVISPASLDDFPYRSLAIDPAISNKPGADFCTIACCGMTEKGHISVLDVWGKVGASPREQVDTYFDFFSRFRPRHCGVEAIAYQAALIHILREEMFRKKLFFQITPIKHSSKKEERVEGILQPRYANGYITHAKKFPQLETQLLDWPNGKMDFPDVVAMCIALLDPHAGAAGMIEKDLADDEYGPLEDELDPAAAEYRRKWGVVPARIAKRSAKILNSGSP